MTVNDKIYTEIAQRQHITKAKVEEVVKSMFQFLVEQFNSGEHNTPIRMQYMGIWQCKPARVEKLKEKGLIHD